MPKSRELSAYDFVPTEYVSQNGMGCARIRRVAHGWTLSVYQGTSYVCLTTVVDTLEQALAAYDAWVHAPSDNDVDF